MVFRTEFQSSKDSAFHRDSWSSEAEEDSGMPLGPAIPALLTAAEVSLTVAADQDEQIPTEEVDKFFSRRDFFDKLVQVCFRSHIARAHPDEVTLVPGFTMAEKLTVLFAHRLLGYVSWPHFRGPPYGGL